LKDLKARGSRRTRKERRQKKRKKKAKKKKKREKRRKIKKGTNRKTYVIKRTESFSSLLSPFFLPSFPSFLPSFLPFFLPFPSLPFPSFPSPLPLPSFLPFVSFPLPIFFPTSSQSSNRALCICLSHPFCPFPRWFLPSSPLPCSIPFLLSFNRLSLL